jgi:hypothetical protein
MDLVTEYYLGCISDYDELYYRLYLRLSSAAILYDTATRNIPPTRNLVDTALINKIMAELKLMRDNKCKSINIYSKQACVYKNYLRNMIYKICVICEDNNLAELILGQITVQQLVNNEINQAAAPIIEAPLMPTCTLCGANAIEEKKINSCIMMICNACTNCWLQTQIQPGHI